MSSYSEYYSYPEQSQVLLAAAFEYGQFQEQRSKTPTSLINHTGHSPGPLSTPLSRNPSQPSDQVPQQIWHESSGSQSDSPTSSVQTPDNDGFDYDMWDGSEPQHNLHNPIQNTAMATGQLAQEGVPALDTSFFLSNQAIQAAQNAEIASASQQYNLSASITSQGHYAHAMPASHMFYGQSYGFSSQPPHQDPWTSQRPPQNPTVPRSGDALFDPVSDAADYSAHVNADVFAWTDNNTDPSYLLSPNDPVAPPHDTFFPPIHTTFSQQYQQQYHNHSPMETGHSPVGLSVTVPSPSDSYNFIHYDHSSALFTNNYINQTQYQNVSPDTSTMGQMSYPSSAAGPLSRTSSNSGQIRLSPYPVAASPQEAVPSPVNSDAMLPAFQQDESAMGSDSFLQEPYLDGKPTAPSSFAHNYRPALTGISKALSDTSDDDMDTIPPPPRPQPSGKGSASRPGGRAVGTHLAAPVAKAAHDMRKIVACWHCVLQRDKCGPGDICDRCLKRSQRPNADCGLGCSRIKLIELTQYFLPSLITQMHEDVHLTHFVSQHIRQWGNKEITIHMTCGQKSLPRIPVKVYEFLPIGNELLVQIQYKTDPETHQRVPVRKQSPALGMVHITHNDEKRYDRYISEIVDHHLDAFGELCWMEDDNDFQQKLFKLMTRVKPKSDDEAKLLREVFRLIVATFIMSHTLTMAEEHKHTALSKMHSYQGPHSYVENFTSPRMANRQLKYFFNRLHRTIMSTVLNKLQQIFKSSKGCDKWLAAFVAVLGMSMAHEDQQKTIHLVMETRAATEGSDRRDLQAQADIACREIDARMGFIAHIFRWKYNRRHNPLRDAEQDWEAVAGFGDAGSVGFVRSVAQLVKENIDFLQVRQSVSISPANQTKYTSRLVGQFLLSFWLPQM